MAGDRCLGFDENGGFFACPNPPGTRWTHLWCEECDERRRTRISSQLERLHSDLTKGA
jgi:hypothetical protein